MDIEFFEVKHLKHIEGFSQKRVEWLRNKILNEKIWTKPLAVDNKYGLVLDGQHRMEVALSLNLLKVPVIRFVYAEVPIRSLRKKYSFSWKDVQDRAINGNPYPYKTVKHDFVNPLPEIEISIEDLK